VRLAILAQLALAASAVTFHRVTTRAVLWDLSYVLNHAYRLAHGQLPYRDYPQPHPPGTFALQALLIRLVGPDYRVVVLYVVLASTAAFFLTFAIARMLVGAWPHATAVAAIIVSPLVFFGIYSIYPHPFYDPDTTLFMLLGIAGVLAVKRLSPTPVVAVPVGALLVLPVFFKQNTGVAYFVLMHLGLLSLLFERSPGDRRRWLYVVAGSAAGLALAALVIALTVGMGNYLHWTIEFASSRRLQGARPDLGIYRSSRLWIGVAAFLAALFVLRRFRGGPAAVAAVCLFAVGPVPLAREVWLGHEYGVLDVWPFVIALSCVLALRRFATGRPEFEDFLPFVVLGVAHASFLSQGLANSTYGIWPLLMVSLAVVAREAPRYVERRFNLAVVFHALLAGAVLWGGAVYLDRDTRLQYVPRQQAPLAASTFPTLAGMHEPGTILLQLDALLRYVERNIPEDEGVIVLPGEDPIYYALDRLPRFPIVLFDYTLNPYSLDQLAALEQRRDIRWVIVKDDPQFFVPVPEELVTVLTQGFTLRARLDVYRIYTQA
jgi:hypothetical protein